MLSLLFIYFGFDNKGFLSQLQVCKIVEGQRYTKKLNDQQVSSLLRATCQRPNVREENIKRVCKHTTILLGCFHRSVLGTR